MVGGHEPTRNGALHEGGGKGQLDDVAGHGHGREQRLFGHRHRDPGAPRPGTRSEPRAVIAHQVAVVDNASGASFGVEQMKGAEKFAFRAGVVTGVLGGQRVGVQLDHGAAGAQGPAVGLPLIAINDADVVDHPDAGRAGERRSFRPDGSVEPQPPHRERRCRLKRRDIFTPRRSTEPGVGRDNFLQRTNGKGQHQPVDSFGVRPRHDGRTGMNDHASVLEIPTERAP